MELTFDQFKAALKPRAPEYHEETQRQATREWAKYKNQTVRYDTCCVLAENLPQEYTQYRHVILNEHNTKIFFETNKFKIVQACYCEAKEEMKRNPEVRQMYRHKLFYKIMYRNRKKHASKESIEKQTDEELDAFVEQNFKDFIPHYHIVCFTHASWDMTKYDKHPQKQKNQGRIIKFKCMEHIASAINYCRKQEATKICTEHLHSTAVGIFCNFSYRNCKKCDEAIDFRFNHDYFKCQECAMGKIKAVIKNLRNYKQFTAPCCLFKDLAMWFRQLTADQKKEIFQQIPYQLLTYGVPFDEMARDRAAWDKLEKNMENAKRSDPLYDTSTMKKAYLEEVCMRYKQYPVFDELREFTEFRRLDMDVFNITELS